MEVLDFSEQGEARIFLNGAEPTPEVWCDYVEQPCPEVLLGFQKGVLVAVIINEQGNTLGLSRVE